MRHTSVVVLFFFCFFYEQSQTEGWKCLNRLNYSSFCFTICFFSLKEGAREHCRLQLFCSLRLLRFLFVRVGVCGLFYVLENTEQSFVHFRSLIYDKLTYRDLERL